MLFAIFSERFNPYEKSDQAHVSGSNVPMQYVEFKVAQDPNYRPDTNILVNENLAPNWLIALMKRCWSHNTASRPSFSEILIELAAVKKGGESDSIVVYLLLKEHKEESEAQDCTLSDFSLTGLQRMVRTSKIFQEEQKRRQRNDKGRFDEYVVDFVIYLRDKTDKDNLLEICDDMHVKNDIHADDILIIAFNEGVGDDSA